MNSRKLQDFEAKGGRVTVPVGCNGFEDWLLDNVDVQKLLPLLRSGMQRDQHACCLCIRNSFARLLFVTQCTCIHTTLVQGQE